MCLVGTLGFSNELLKTDGLLLIFEKMTDT